MQQIEVVSDEMSVKDRRCLEVIVCRQCFSNLRSYGKRNFELGAPTHSLGVLQVLACVQICRGYQSVTESNRAKQIYQPLRSATLLYLLLVPSKNYLCRLLLKLHSSACIEQARSISLFISFAVCISVSAAEAGNDVAAPCPGSADDLMSATMFFPRPFDADLIALDKALRMRPANGPMGKFRGRLRLPT